MLEKVRKPGRKKNIVAYIIFGLICFVFVFMGIVPDQGGMTGAGAAATVNDTVISMQDFQEMLASEQSRMADKQGSALERRRRDRQVRQGVIERLVTYEVFYQYGIRAGILPVTNAVRDMIVSVPQFQENGRFQRDLYDRYLSMVRSTASDFERRIARDVVIRNLQQLFTSSWKPSSLVEKLDATASETKLEVEFIRINEDEIAKVMATKGRAQSWLRDEANKKRIAELYERRKSEFKTQEEVRARHILIKSEDPKSDSVALKTANEVYAQAKDGDFAELAKKFSQDAGTASKGGDLGFFQRGRMVEEFESAAFSMVPGTVSEPVKSSFGYHVIKVEEKRGGDVKPLAQVEMDLAVEELAQTEFDKVVQDFTERLKESGGIQDLIKKYGLKWENSGEFNLKSYMIPKIEAGEEAITAVLSQPKPGQLPKELLASGPNRYLLRLKKITHPTAKSQETEGPFFGGGTELLFKWAEEKRKEARIQINEVVLN